jgi:hypothetical protein
MACDTKRLSEKQTAAERKKQIDTALAALKRGLSTGAIKVVIGANGAISFYGWAEGTFNKVSDACAYRTLTSQGSSELRNAIAKTGKKVNPQAVAAGWHSHDGGKSWGKH